MPSFGVSCATKLATDAGGWRQVNRAGYPMMWPICWPDDTHFTNPANARHPTQDLAADGGHFASQVAAVVAASGTVGDPEGYGQTVAGQLLPDILPYQIGTPATFGFAVRASARGRHARPRCRVRAARGERWSSRFRRGRAAP
jgi:hypothetical protein